MKGGELSWEPSSKGTAASFQGPAALVMSWERGGGGTKCGSRCASSMEFLVRGPVVPTRVSWDLSAHLVCGISVVQCFLLLNFSAQKIKLL